MSAAAIKREIAALANPSDVEILQRFFKAGPGEYGEGDVFVGVKVPPLRKVAKAHLQLSLDQIDRLLDSEIHEYRATGLMILTYQAEGAALDRRRLLYDFYLARTPRINNWDLVDLSCREVIGGYLLAIDDWTPLENLAGSDLLWDRRIAIVSTWQFIRAGELTPTFAIAQQLLSDSHDLIHKAVGWMLREAGKRDLESLERFLDRYATSMPRIALRYSIERMDPERRAYWRSR